MPEYDFSLVEAAIIDNQHNTVRLLREMLVRLGVKKIETFTNVKDASVMLTGATPDLVLMDADGDEAETFRFVRALRNEPGTPNPFACLVITTWQPTPALVMRVTNSGADDLMVKPVSPKQVQDRVGILIEGRKRFVVTADYTGPDRRKSPREGAQVPLIEVPNTLRLKATNRWAHTNVRQLMAEAVVNVNEQKTLRASIQAGFLVEFAMPGLAAAPIDRMALEHLARVPGVVDDLVRRLPEGEDSSTSTQEVVRALKQAIEGVRVKAETGPVDAAELARLRGLSHDLMREVDPKRALDDMVREVEAAVAGYRGRLQQIVQAKAVEAAKAMFDENRISKVAN